MGDLIKKDIGIRERIKDIEEVDDCEIFTELTGTHRENIDDAYAWFRIILKDANDLFHHIMKSYSNAENAQKHKNNLTKTFNQIYMMCVNHFNKNKLFQCSPCLAVLIQLYLYYYDFNEVEYTAADNANTTTKVLIDFNIHPRRRDYNYIEEIQYEK